MVNLVFVAENMPCEVGIGAAFHVIDSLNFKVLQISLG